MVLARLTIWRFKEGTRDKAFTELDEFLNNSTRNAKGFRGYMSMLSKEEPNVASTLTLWQDEETLKESEAGVFVEVIRKIEETLVSPPKLENYSVFSTELFLRSGKTSQR